MNYKMYCIFAMDSVQKMGGNRGKMSSQAGHAFLHSYWDAMGLNTPKDIRYKVNFYKYEQAVAYSNSGLAFKITLKVDTVTELLELQKAYSSICGTSLVTDAGRTVFDEPTITCLGIGPIAECNIKDDLKSLKVLI